MSLRWSEIVRAAARTRRGRTGTRTSRPIPRRGALEALEERTLLTTSDPLAGFLTGPNLGAPLEIAKDYLSTHGAAFGFAPGDAQRAIVTDQYTDAKSGITHIYLTQGFDGIAVENARISIAIGPLGQVIFAGGNFVPGLGATPSNPAPPAPQISAQQAITAAAAQLNLPDVGAILEVATPAGISQSGSYSVPAIATQDIPVHLDFVWTPQGVREAWALNIQTPTQPTFHWYDVRVDAVTGQISDVNDWVDYAGDGSSYNYYNLPGISPNDGPRTIQFDPSNPLASPFGWLDRNGKAGVDTTVTNGANVNAYLDLKGTGSGFGNRPNAGPGLAFDFPIDLTKDPTTYTDASTTNLFVLDNIVHDVLYQYGFNEAAGNFQLNNYGRGGLAGDAVKAAVDFGADVGDLNNAFMSTPPDGQAPLQAMFLWDQNIVNGSPTTPRRDGSLDETVVVHELNHGTSIRLTGGPADANALDAVQSGGMGEGWSDWYALMFSQVATDGLATYRTIANYANGQNGVASGIRTFPYSYDKTIDPRTIGGYNTNGEVHDTGEIWCAALWDLNMLLTAKYGFNPDIAGGYVDDSSGGNTLALQLVTDALKLQPANPSFSDARNAILAADQALTGGANQYEIWSAFARRGMGFSFSDGGSSNAPVVTEAFDLPNILFVQGIKTIKVDENTSLDGVKVASFFDPITGQSPGNYKATIDWGDGTKSTGLVSVNTQGGFDITAVGKVYDQGGNYTVNISVQNTATKTAGANKEVIQVIDSPFIVSSAASLSGVEGTSQKFIFGSFVDTDTRLGDPSTYKVAVTWGDGSIGTGTLVADPTTFNKFIVTAVNDYPRFGDYTYTATVTGPGGSQAIYNSDALIADAPLSVAPSPAGFNPVEGKFFSGSIAAFSDSNPFGLLSDLLATIDWGDGHVTPGLVSRDLITSNAYLVTGSNKYTKFGTYNYIITVDSVGGSSVSIPGTVVVSDAPISSQGTSFGIVEGQTFSGLLATLKDSNPASSPTDFTATVDWNDGSPLDTAQIVPGGSGGYLVKGTHRYNQEGVFKAKIVVVGDGGSTTSSTTTATVSNASLTGSSVGLGPLADIEGQVFSGVVAQFIDGNPTEPLGDFTLAIDWGDGTTSAGTVSQLPDGTFEVSGSHLYPHFGTFTIGTVIQDNAGGSTSASIPITVSDATFSAAGFPVLLAKEGTPFTGVLATFVDTNPNPLLGDFTSTIDWGDGSSPSAGSITQNSSDGSFEIANSHTFAVQSDPYDIAITVKSASGATEVVHSFLTVELAALTPTLVPPPTPLQGVRFNALVANFIDDNPNPAPGEFSATIDWGDQTPASPGIILANVGSFDVRGSHLYTQPGQYTLQVDIRDADGSTAQTRSTVIINDAALTPGTELKDLPLVEGQYYTAPVAFFQSANPLAISTDYIADIDWGDSTTTEKATITAVGAAGNFAVSDSIAHPHAYRFGQSPIAVKYPITVIVRSPGGSKVQIQSTADVADAPLKAVAFPIALKVGSDVPITVAQVTDGNTLLPGITPQNPSGDLSAVIAWGDGTQGAGTLTATGVPGQFSISGSHAYVTSGTYAAVVTVNDVGGQSTSVNVPITISAATISTSLLPIIANEDATIVDDVARFSTENILAMPGDFTAMIRWGDGTLSQGHIVAIAPRVFDVNATHTYTNSGNFPVSVTVQSGDKVQSTATGTISVADRIVLVTGGLSSSSDTGTSSSDGITRINQPVYSGTAEVGDIVTLTGQRPGMSQPVVIGQTTAGADGSWSLTTVPLVDGSYAITASAADAAGHVSSPPQTFSTLVVDTSGPRITGVSLNPRTGQVRISVQDDRTGFSDATLSNPANYSLFLPSRGSRPLPIAGVSVSPGGATDTRVITLDVSLGGGKKRAAKAGKYVLSINGENLSDLAGNALDERFFTLSTPTGKGSYIAQLVTDGRTTAGPSVVTNQSTPKPPRALFVKARRHHR